MSPEDERRYRDLFDGCYRPLLAYALRRTETRSAAEEVVAETFLVAWRRSGDVPGDDREALWWLLGVARRVAANERRGDGRRQRLIGRLRHHQRDATVEPSPEDAVLGSDDSVRVRAALGRLRPAEAELLRLAFWDELPHAEIAGLLDCSVNAVDIRLHRARRALQAELEKGSDPAGHRPGTDDTASGSATER